MDPTRPVSAAVLAARERERLAEDAERDRNWKRWGPYLSERQWGTVREDYSAYGSCWDYFPHDHARSRTYRWGEDGLLGITDRQCRLCFAVALWNGKDPILKERLFGLTGPEGNHGEDVKELYYYLDSTPTHSYLRALYKYPHAEFPYAHLLEENRKRGKFETEYELVDTGVFGEGRYFDVEVEYGKATPNDLAIRISVTNRGPERAALVLLPTLWYRNTWSWGSTHEGYWGKPRMVVDGDGSVVGEHASLGRYRFVPSLGPDGVAPELVFTDNETNAARLYGVANASPFVKDAFHEYVIHGRVDAVNPARTGTKIAAIYRLEIESGATTTIAARLFADDPAHLHPAMEPPEAVVDRARQEADAYYGAHLPAHLSDDERRVVRQGYAGMLWSKQFYHYVVRDWLDGDPAQPTPPPERKSGRNRDWLHVYNRDVISMPDKWEYPWFAAWDLAFHMLPFARLDPHFAKEQLVLLLREWYMHPNGQIPAYEFAFSDVNPPVHAWACWRVYKMSASRGRRDRLFLSRVFQKLLINFTWWVNRKDLEGNHLFTGGFLGLDNIGVFDRSKPLPTGGFLEQADGTAWMAFYSATMLSIALELAKDNPATEDVASKFFEHFVAIVDAMNRLGGTGLWDEEDGFYYDQLHLDGRHTPLKVRSLVGLIPLIAVEVLEGDTIERLAGFSKRLEWFVANRDDLRQTISYLETRDDGEHQHRLLAVPSRERLVRVLRYMLDESEFLSPYGIRSISRIHHDHPYVFHVNGDEHRVAYDPGESTSGLFGGNSNWRGPIWFPINYLLVEALERYHHFYGDSLRVECPTGSGHFMSLGEVAREIARRLSRIFLADEHGRRPCHGDDERYASDPAFRDLALFYEYFHGDTGRGVGASHQTGWTGLVVRLLEKHARAADGEHRRGQDHGHDHAPRASAPGSRP